MTAPPPQNAVAHWQNHVSAGKSVWTSVDVCGRPVGRPAEAVSPMPVGPWSTEAGKSCKGLEGDGSDGGSAY